MPKVSLVSQLKSTNFGMLSRNYRINLLCNKIYKIQNGDLIGTKQIQITCKRITYNR